MPKTFSFADAQAAPPAKTFSFADASKPAPAPAPTGFETALTEARGRTKNNEVAGALAQGATFGTFDEIDAAEEGAVVGAENLGRRLFKKSIPYTSAEASRAVLQADREQQAAFAAKHPIMHLALEGGGSLLAPGVGPAGKLISKAGGPVMKTAASALTGAGLGAAAGAGEAQGGVKQRLEGAEKGAVAGGLFGGVAEPLAELGGVGVKALGRLIHRGGDLSKSVINRLQHTLAEDGIDLAKGQAMLKEWLDTGAPPPEFVTLAGPNTKAAIRAAAVKHGEARTAIVEHLENVQENLRGRGQDRARELTPETRSATELREHLEQARDSLADHQYERPYAEKTPATIGMLQAISDPEGAVAVRRAMQEARARQDYDRADELAALSEAIKTVDNPKLSDSARGQMAKALLAKLPPISGGALDRIRVAFKELGRASFKAGKKGVGEGYGNRADQIDAELDKIEGLKPARATYRAHQEQLQAIDYAQGTRIGYDGVPHEVSGTGVLKAAPDVFAKKVKAMSPEARGAAQVGARQAIIDAMDKGATALPTLKRMGYDNAVKKNLTALFGKDQAERYAAAAKLEYKRLKTANFLSPEQGSKTTDVGQNMSMFEVRHMLQNPAMASIVHLISRANTMSDPERQLMVEMGLGNADDVLRKVLLSPKPRLRVPPGTRERLGAAGAATAGQVVNQQ